MHASGIPIPMHNRLYCSDEFQHNTSMHFSCFSSDGVCLYANNKKEKQYGIYPAELYSNA